jgi:hypothetical protein
MGVGACSSDTSRVMRSAGYEVQYGPSPVRAALAQSVLASLSMESPAARLGVARDSQFGSAYAPFELRTRAAVGCAAGRLLRTATSVTKTSDKRAVDR